MPTPNPGFPPHALALRRDDPDRFVTALLAPDARRPALFTLYALNAEIARIPEMVQEPMLGRIRLQWWADLVDALQAGQPAPTGHPLAQALAEMVAVASLPAQELAALFSARAWDYQGDSMPDHAALTAYARGSGGALARLALRILAGAARPSEAELDAAEKVGTAYALVGLVRAAPFLARRRRLVLPGTDAAALAAGDGEASPALRATARAVAEEAAALLRAARLQCPRVDRERVAALLPAVLAEGYLSILRASAYDPRVPAVSAARRRPLRLMIQAWRGRY